VVGSGVAATGMTYLGQRQDIGTASHSLDMGFQAGLTDPG
jgi:hypothetical protein